MILYLTENRRNLLDFTQHLDNPNLKILEGNFHLTDFAKTTLRNFEGAKELFIDTECLLDEADDIAEAIRTVRKLSNIRISIISESILEEQKQKYLDAGVRNIISAESIDQIKEEITESLSKTGMKKYMPEDERVISQLEGTINIVGASRKIGATTVAFSLSSFFIERGLESVNLDTNCDGAWNEAFGSNLVDSVSEKASLRIVDQGTAEIDCDLTILVCGSKIYEIPESAKLVMSTKGEKVILLPFVPEEKREEVRAFFSKGSEYILFMEYQPSLTEVDANRTVYTEIAKLFNSIKNKEKGDAK